VLLAISAFSLSLLGAFLVRSGVLSSVHAFATDPARGVFLLILLVAVVGGSLMLFALRAPTVGLGGRFGLVSRESLLLTNNMLLAVACASVLLGTLYPLLIDALGLGKLSVGPPYFDAVFAPLMLPLLFLTGVGPFARWKQDRLPALAHSLRWIFLCAAFVGIAAPFAAGEWKPWVALALSLAAWIVLAGLSDLVRRARAAHGRLSAGFLGMHLAHFGVAVFLAGVAVVGGYQQEKDVRMAVGDTVEMAGYAFRFNGVRQERGANYTALAGELDLVRGGRGIARLRPEKRFYSTSAMPMTEAAIDVGFLRDLYVSLGEPVDKANPAGDWIVRVHFKPLIGWIWGGCALMALGGLLAVCDRRYRMLRTEKSGMRSTV
jgi:cytochrome c-type biogenesis protein CcmF